MSSRSSVLTNDWRNAMDLVHCDKRGLQHRWCNNLCRSPTELFAQHVISIVHYVTGDQNLYDIMNTVVMVVRYEL